MSNYLKHMETVGRDTAFDRRVSYIHYNYRQELQELTAHSRILEIGPGRGELLSILNHMGFSQIDIIDIDQAVLDYCKKTFSIGTVIKERSLDLSKCVSGKYDLIVLTQVFEHIPKSSYQNWIKTLYRALNPRGKIVITVPNGANPLVGTERYGDLQHENVFTIFSFQELMTFADLNKATYVIRGFEIPPSSLLSLIRIILQKILHGLFIVMMMINGAIYQTLMTPNISLVITKNA